MNDLAPSPVTAEIPPVRKILDLDAKQKVGYCIPLWLRDEQIKQAVLRVKDRLQPVEEQRTDPIAIVGFGPSLQTTWEQLKAFKYIITCSGSHKFLLERGIVPTYHVEVDPREHKVTLLGPPHPDVEYLIASTCHPKYFDHLEGYKVKLWHIFDSTEEGLRMLPRSEWAVTGGCDAGLRAMTLAAFLGFRDLHIFGLDGSTPAPDGLRHAAEHPNGKQKYSVTKYKDQEFYTTPAMLEAAKQTFHELRQMPKVQATFYGEGLTQEMAKDYRPPKDESPKPLNSVIAFVKPDLISDAYRKLNADLHQQNLAYGVGGGKHADIVLKLVASLNTTSVLDYGCGKGYLAKALSFPIWEYDPAIPEKSLEPRPADIVVCTDVLEHIEPEKLQFVLRDLQRVTKKVLYAIIHTGPAGKTLSDGRNTHLIQRDRRWWDKKLSNYFKIGQTIEKLPELHYVLAPQLKLKKKKA